MTDKFGDARRTKIVPQELGRMSDEDLIPDEQVAIVMTRGNYIKRTLATDYRRQNRGGKGKRGGLRVIYYWWDPKKQFWLFTIYDKDELSDLSPKEKTMLKTLLKQELEERK